MSILAWIEDQKRLKLLNAPQYVNPSSDSSKGLWTRCDKCGVILYIKHLKENQRVCFGCSYHLQMSSPERVQNLLDQDTWRPFDETVSPCDPLEFYDNREYTARLEDAQEQTGLQDAIQTGTGMVDGIPVALGVMDFAFMGGSMGSVVGEKVTRLIEYATQEGLTLILVCASGGARMQEGVFSLMQMAKISSALQVYQSCANLLYISILTSPTTGGVTASFAMLGDIIFAEPKALIAFAGRRVIEQTLCEDLPDDFQTAEYMLHHGLLDLIVPRRFLRQALSESIRLYKNAPFKKPGRIPFGVQNPISFLTEEKIRRQWITVNDSKGEDSAKAYEEVTGKRDLPSTHGLSLNLETAESANFSMDQHERLIDLSKSEPYLGGAKPIDNQSQKPLRNGSSRNEISQDLSKAQQIDFNASNNDQRQPGPAGFIDSTSSQSQLKKSKKLEKSHIKRESMEYRDILTSFQTMFHLFSKQMVLPYSLDINPTPVSSQKGNFQNSKNEDLGRESIEFLNQAIQVAATESVQWRAFYVHQRISKTTGFLEDFLQPFSENIQEEKIVSESHLNPAFQNTLFYKSICTISGTMN
uniref:beta subunit of acetyl-CoA carboxylase carboxytransferase n=1 Tax=Massjukichlorella minus TaxID=2650457 RepID=UPI002410DE53|nr:beta subunit of acetyl-CoA carboxylase carboxytransferase [Massjukichlorella minus]WDY12982.1 beta subunit of acetyl-CoA carboxylase carboxytransferase [Massjukichlorella minus]